MSKELGDLFSGIGNLLRRDIVTRSPGFTASPSVQVPSLEALGITQATSNPVTAQGRLNNSIAPGGSDFRKQFSIGGLVGSLVEGASDLLGDGLDFVSETVIDPIFNGGSPTEALVPDELGVDSDILGAQDLSHLGTGAGLGPSPSQLDELLPKVGVESPVGSLVDKLIPGAGDLLNAGVAGANAFVAGQNAEEQRELLDRTFEFNKATDERNFAEDQKRFAVNTAIGIQKANADLVAQAARITAELQRAKANAVQNAFGNALNALVSAGRESSGTLGNIGSNISQAISLGGRG